MNKNGHGHLPSLTFLLSLMMIPIVGLSISRGLWRSTGQLSESWLVAEYCAVQGIVACGLVAGCDFFIVICKQKSLLATIVFLCYVFFEAKIQNGLWRCVARLACGP